MKLPDGLLEDIKEKMTESGELQKFLNTSVDDMIGLHMSLGMYIRNEYKLWENYNEETDMHPDDASWEMIKELQKQMKAM